LLPRQAWTRKIFGFNANVGHTSALKSGNISLLRSIKPSLAYILLSTVPWVKKQHANIEYDSWDAFETKEIKKKHFCMALKKIICHKK